MQTCTPKAPHSIEIAQYGFQYQKKRKTRKNGLSSNSEEKKNSFLAVTAGFRHLNFAESFPNNSDRALREGNGRNAWKSRKKVHCIAEM